MLGADAQGVLRVLSGFLGPRPVAEQPALVGDVNLGFVQPDAEARTRHPVLGAATDGIDLGDRAHAVRGVGLVADLRHNAS